MKLSTSGIRQLLAWIIVLLCVTMVHAQSQKAPAYPLITHDPYFSIWSFSDELNTSSTKHPLDTIKKHLTLVIKSN